MGASKQFCIRGHDTFVSGRQKNGTCHLCVVDSHKKDHARNPEKQRLRSRKHYALFKDAENATARKKYAADPAKYLARINHYRTSNKSKVDSYRRLYERAHKSLYIKNRKETDPLFRLTRILRSRVHSALSPSWEKLYSFNEYIGCSPEELKRHVEKQFTPGMTWQNHSPRGWHLDHIIPLSSASSAAELFKLCHYTNIQPLWAADNLRKGNKIHG